MTAGETWRLVYRPYTLHWSSVYYANINININSVYTRARVHTRKVAVIVSRISRIPHTNRCGAPSHNRFRVSAR